MELLTKVAALIAGSTTAFAVRGSDNPALTSMYFLASEGIAELEVGGGHIVVAEPDEGSVGALVARHLRGDPATILLCRYRKNGETAYWALGGGRHAHSRDGDTWVLADGSVDSAEALRKFLEE